MICDQSINIEEKKKIVHERKKIRSNVDDERYASPVFVSLSLDI